MKASALLISWHDDNAPIYSAHFEPSGKGRLATAGGDNNVRLWQMEKDGEARKINYLTTLIKHTQAVNVVRFAPRGEVLASAGDDGNVLLWVPAGSATPVQAFGEGVMEDKETWRTKHMCRSSGSEIYDLAWSPDGIYFVTGSMDNIARVYNAQTGQMIRQIAEHNHYVQGVAWDPLNEYLATQSSDRSCHIYNLKTKDGQFTLNSYNKMAKMDHSSHRMTAASPAPLDLSARWPVSADPLPLPSSPLPHGSMPGTPTSMNPMNPPTVTHSRRSSFGSSPAIRRSASPAPSMPLPAVRPMEHSPKPSLKHRTGTSTRNSNLYANETLNSFFRRLSFAPDGSLLFTPAGQWKSPVQSCAEGTKPSDEITNTVYIYTRAGLNKPPIAHLPGHKKPSIVVRCSPIFYSLRQPKKSTINIVIDTSSAEDAILDLPAPVVSSTARVGPSSMDPPPTIAALVKPSATADDAPSTQPRGHETENAGSVFALPYRIVYAVATQDSVLIYDTQHESPLIVVSNLHYATFTDLTWANDGLTLLMSSSDGFCSHLSFGAGELGQIFPGHVPTVQNPSALPASAITTPITSIPATVSAAATVCENVFSGLAMTATSPSPRPLSPTRSNSMSSVATTESSQPTVINNPTPSFSSVPSVSATGTPQPLSFGGLPWTTPPQTPAASVQGEVSKAGSSSSTVIPGQVLGKRDVSETKQQNQVVTSGPDKRRRIAPTPVTREERSPRPS